MPYHYLPPHYHLSSCRSTPVGQKLIATFTYDSQSMSRNNCKFDTTANFQSKFFGLYHRVSTLFTIHCFFFTYIYVYIHYIYMYNYRWTLLPAYLDMEHMSDGFPSQLFPLLDA